MAERRDEAGATTIVVLALAFALVLVAWGAGSVVGTVVAHRVAQNAADLAALAAAQDGCSVAAEVAAANNVRLVSCQVEGAEALVEVAVAVPTAMGREVHARARAGPS